MHLLGADYAPTLLEYIDASQLPRRYGGTCDIDFVQIGSKEEGESFYRKYKAAYERMAAAEAARKAKEHLEAARKANEEAERRVRAEAMRASSEEAEREARDEVALYTREMQDDAELICARDEAEIKVAAALASEVLTTREAEPLAAAAVPAGPTSGAPNAKVFEAWLWNPSEKTWSKMAEVGGPASSTRRYTVTPEVFFKALRGLPVSEEEVQGSAVRGTCWEV
jgi:hypothetical protein